MINGPIRVAIAALATAVAAAAYVAVPQSATAATAKIPGKYAPTSGTLLGGYINLSGRWETTSKSISDVAGRERLLGRGLDINHHFYGWSQSFPTALEKDDAAHGRIPLISWTGPRLNIILNGSQDSIIRARAKAVKAFGKPVMIRWDWEMNGNWEAGGGYQNNDPGRTNGPAKFVAAWRRIHDIFRNAGVTNVAWVWAPNHNDVPQVGWNHWTRYYPGDAYVDWVGVSSYNWGNLRWWSKFAPFGADVAPLYRDYRSKKPFMLCETGSTESGGSKAGWIRGLQSTLKTAFPDVSAIVWFDENKETNWRIDSSSSALSAYKTLAKDSYYNTRH